VRRRRRIAQETRIVANVVIDVLGDDERFCFHMAAEMEPPKVRPWLTRLRKKALANARRALAPLITADVIGVAVVATDRDPGRSTRFSPPPAHPHCRRLLLPRRVPRRCSVPVHLVPPEIARRRAVSARSPPGRGAAINDWPRWPPFSLLDR
jgi:hypothetical protein